MFLYDLTIGIISNLISNWLSKDKEKISNPVNSEIKIQSVKKKEEPIAPLTYNQQVSERLLLSMEMMSLEYDKLSISKICDYLGYNSVNLIDDYFHAKQEPTIDFLQSFSNFFGIEFKWLRHGEGNKFKKLIKYPTYPRDYMIQITEIKPEQIFFVRSTDDNGEAGIILRLTNFNFLILPRTYSISSFIGDTGRIQIVSFYDLIRNISISFPSHKLSGLLLSKDAFDDLFMGEVYPGKYFNGYRQASYWWDDFLDYNHKFPVAKDYEHLYGKEFLAAQKIVRLDKEKKCA